MRLSRSFGVGVLAAATPALASNIIQNGDFETYTGHTTGYGPGLIAIAAPGDMTYPTDQLNNWTLTENSFGSNPSNGVDGFYWVINNSAGYGLAQSGSNFLNLGTSESAAQTFAVSAGTTYTVSYYQAQRATGGTTDVIDTSVSLAAGTASGTLSQTAGNTAGNASVGGWQLFTFSFTPNSSTNATLTIAARIGFRLRRGG